ncbi:MAG: hypothetical protein WCX22_10100, partial [Methanoregula sp.]
MFRMFSRLNESKYRDFFIILPLIAFFSALLCLSAGNLSGDLGEFVLAGGMVAPFVILALLAHMGEKHA